MDFEAIFSTLLPIVNNTRKNFFVKLWDYDDWVQEGRIILLQLLQDKPQLLNDSAKLRAFFKVRFNHYIIDVVRKQQAVKRTFDRLNHEDIEHLAHKVPSAGLLNDEFIVLRDRLRQFRYSLSPEQLLLYEKLLEGQKFNGRRQLINKLKGFLEE